MKRFAFAALSAAFLLSSLGMASAQPAPRPGEEPHPGEMHHNAPPAPARHWQETEQHGDWHRGQPMPHEDWQRGRHVDYRTYGLRRPPAGYEWREVDGAFILGAITTGVITSIMMQGQ